MFFESGGRASREKTLKYMTRTMAVAAVTRTLHFPFSLSRPFVLHIYSIGLNNSITLGSTTSSSQYDLVIKPVYLLTTSSFLYNSADTSGSTTYINGQQHFFSSRWSNSHGHFVHPVSNSMADLKLLLSPQPMVAVSSWNNRDK